MVSRINPYHQAKDLVAAFYLFDDRVNATTLDLKLVELVKIRASQLNGCISCLDTHIRRAREKAGESELRLALLDAWREATLYTDRERAALAWAEAVTLVADSHVPDDVYEEVRAHFTDDELVELTMIVTTINAWNRFGVAFRRPHSRKPITAGD